MNNVSNSKCSVTGCRNEYFVIYDIKINRPKHRTQIKHKICAKHFEVIAGGELRNLANELVIEAAHLQADERVRSGSEDKK